MDTFGILFGSQARVKLIRLFLLNPEEILETTDVVKRSRVTNALARKEIAILSRAGLIKKKSFWKESASTKKGGKPVKKRASGWQLDANFALMKQLRNFLLDTDPLRREEVANRFRGSGKIKLLIVSGLFIGARNSRVDLLLVGDNLSKARIEHALRTIESEVGKELSYAYFDTQEFTYRVGICDKFVRDVLDYPHEKVINRLAASLDR
jgi:hypothetical protein